MKIHELVFIFFVNAIVFISGCSSTQVTGTSEQGNARVACVVGTPQGTASANAIVRLRTADFLASVTPAAKQASVTIDTLTDSMGRFQFRDLSPGNYSIEVNDTAHKSSLLLTFQLGKDSVINFGIETALPYARLSGWIDISANRLVRRYVQVFGLQHIATVDSMGSFSIVDLPQGNLKLRIIAADSLAIHPAVIDSVKTRAGEISSVPTFGWAYSKKLTINTTSSGAQISTTQLGFPLLIRFDSTWFDFSQARDAGQDLRFTSANGKPLPYEIERWNPGTKQGEVWVRVDSIRGNDATQFVSVQWGNSGASSLSSGAAVFDTASGFVAVWHMQSRGAMQFNDATVNQLTGTAHLTSASIPGPVGLAQSFNGQNDYIDCGADPRFDPGSSFTVSAWVELAEIGADRYHRIISKKSAPGAANGFDFAVNGDTLDSAASARPSEFLAGHDSLLVAGYFTWNRAWHFCSITYAADSAHIYLDGTQINVIAVSNLINPAPSQPLLIGAGNGYDFLHGALDEVRIEHDSRSADWVRLSYENQKQGSLVVSK